MSNNPTSQFAGQAAIVTGAGEGIGLEIAKQLTHAGANVLINDVNVAKAQTVAESLSGGGKCIGVGGDVSDVAVVRGLVDKAVAEFGRLDMVIANAGITLWNNFFDYKPEDFQRVLSVNLGGSFFLTQAAARYMRDHGGGRIVLMSSVTGHQAIEYLSAYAMTKAALEMLAKQLTTELARHSITINAVAPGAIVTPRNLADDPNYAEHWSQIIPTGRVGYVEDIANAVLFLLSPASRQITGQTLVVDGGWTAVSPTPALDFVEQKKDS
jgi:glucose 1-dehydrogenase